ncbi:hypothetical protein T459_27332 [Capsicum annuum]|uniref:Replication factor A C-terminal domain-containing protein n=1 Tax=Capsicum annuum TaxID=4072 RepID=A0A2G2YDN3_CAPAN|nr:hypothetical protein T459_27332 [Capsicum annuum]
MDDTGSISLIIWDTDAMSLVGKSTNDLKEGLLQEVDLTIENEEGSSEGVGDFFSDLANAVPEIGEAMSFTGC